MSPRSHISLPICIGEKGCDLQIKVGRPRGFVPRTHTRRRINPSFGATGKKSHLEKKNLTRITDNKKDVKFLPSTLVRPLVGEGGEMCWLSQQWPKKNKKHQENVCPDFLLRFAVLRRYQTSPLEGRQKNNVPCLNISYNIYMKDK